MRSSAACVASTADSSPAAIAAAVAAAVRCTTSGDIEWSVIGAATSLVRIKDAGHPEATVLGGRGAGQGLGGGQRRAGDVPAEHVRQRHGMAGRRDVRRRYL